MRGLLKLTTLIMAVLFSTGCATVMGESKYSVNIQSNPSGASFIVKNRAGIIVHKGVTPQSIVLPSGAGYFKGEKYELTFTPKGKNAVPQTFILDTKLSGWYLGGNLLIGGFVGWLVVDPATGAMFTLPNSFTADLDKGKDNLGLHIISIDVLTAEQKVQLKPIHL